MAKQKQSPTKARPITSHPLFPAVVGLWFGALSGLGSLAVRPSLIEDMVLSTRINLIVPAAAPPLGLTARILLTLVMASLGTIVGVVLAQRLTRPKVELKEPARTAHGAVPTAQTRQRARDAQPDAPSCTPISMQELESGDDLGGMAQTDGGRAGRRRALTVKHGGDQFVPPDFAPLPGGAPQMLDMAELAPSPVPEPAPAESQVVPASDPLPSPSSLSMTDLAARLAESMQRRRAARNAAMAAPAIAEPLAAAPKPVASAPIRFAAPDQVVAMAPEAPAIVVEPGAPVTQPSFAAQILPQAAPVQAEQSPVPAAEPHGDAALPISLRPLALDAFLEEDLAFDASLLPPRRLVAEAPAVPAHPAASAAEPAEPADEPIAEENYASLLGIGGGRTGFVRIEEPAADAAAPEPVVIFPGQSPLGQAPQFTPPTLAGLDEDGASLRRFDSPAAEQSQAVDIGSPEAHVAPEEADQALRTALASLQRISGAA